MESEEDANMDDLLFETFSALENGRGSEEDLKSGDDEGDIDGDEEEDIDGDDEEEVGGDDEAEEEEAQVEKFLAETGRVGQEIGRVEVLVMQLQQGGNEKSKSGALVKASRDGDIAEVDKLVKSVEVGLEELGSWRVEEGSPARITAVSKLRGRFKEIVGQFQALKGRIVMDEKETVKRRYSKEPGVG
jgi:hypothetical protein